MVKTSPSLLLCYFPRWVTGSGSNREDFAEGGVVAQSGKHMRPALCPLRVCSFYSSTLEIDNYILLLFLSWEVPNLNQLGTSHLVSTLVLREKHASLLFLVLSSLVPSYAALCHETQS